jgi:hypothetical protein
MNKVIRDGKVAVLYSPGYGAGWSTWVYTTKEASQAMCMDERIVSAFIDGGPLAAENAVKSIFPDQCVLGSDQLEVAWLPVGTVFEISEYDGYESVRVIDNAEFMVA